MLLSNAVLCNRDIVPLLLIYLTFSSFATCPNLCAGIFDITKLENQLFALFGESRLANRVWTCLFSNYR